VERSYGNGSSTPFDGPAGFNWWMTQLPVASGSSSTVMLFFNPNRVYWFDRSGSNFVPRYSFMRVGLVEDTTAHTLTFTRTVNARIEVTVFNSLSAPTNPGGFVSHADVDGGTTTVAQQTGSQIIELQRSYTVGGTIIAVDSLLYTYFTSGTASGKIQSITWRRQIGGSGSWTLLQQASYAYCGASDPNGNVNDLKTVSRQLPDGAGGWNTVAVRYYRYYLTSVTPGIVHGLKMHFGPEAYRLMFNAGINLATASDATVLPYADHYFEYDSATRQVTKEVSAVCDSCPGGGTTTDLFTYSKNPRNPAPGFNTWSTKAVQALPDGSQNIIYSNYAGLPMLGVTISAAGTSKWGRFYRYDNSSGNRIWKAQPSAVALPASLSTVEAFDDLLNFSGSGGVGGGPASPYLNNSAGLIELTDYYATTDLPHGKVQGYVSDEQVQQGQGGSPVVLKSYTYTSNTASGITIYPVLTEVVYPVAGSSTPAITTSYAYTYHPGTNLLQQKTTTLPAVSTGQNGDGTAPTIVESYDNFGNLTQRTEQRQTSVSVVNQFVYDVTLGVVTQQTLNVQSGVTQPGVNVVTDFAYDAFARLTQTLGSSHTAVTSSGTATTVRGATWNVYVQSVQPTSGTWDTDQNWTGSGYATGSGPSYTYTLVDPVTIVKRNKDGRGTDQITSKRTTGSGALSPTDTFAQTDWRSWSSTQYNPQHQKISDRVYFLIPSSGTGTVGTNYGETDYAYDSLERLTRVQSPGGTITRTVRNTPLLRIDSTWVGTNDAGATDSNPAGTGSPNNMVKVSENQYDSGGIGDGNLTQVTQYVSATSGDTRVTAYGYDFRDRRTSMTDATSRYTVYTLDNLDRLTQTQSYATNGGTLIGQGQSNYDDRNRVYQQLTYAVDPSTGTVGNALIANNWYDYSGNLIQSIAAGDGQVFTKQTYNGVNWVTASYRGFNTGGTSYSQASQTPDVANDIVATQSIPTNDEAGNVISTASFDRLNDAPAPGATGSTGILSAGSDPKARVSYGAAWFDGIDRPIAAANYGAIASLTRPSTPPASSGTVLVSQTAYDDAGRVYQTIDPAGVVNQTGYDAAARTTQTLEDVGSGRLNRTTNYTYTLDNLIATLTSVNASTGDQTTTYTYGTSASSDVYRNDLLASVTYPDSTGGSDVVSYAYNRLGQQRTMTDQRGTVRTFYFDKLGRPTNDCVTTNGTGTDVAVKQVARTYEVRGMVKTITSTDSASQGAGTVLNQVQLDYNTFGQLAAEWQDHGAIVSSSTPKVQYAYDSGGSSSNEIRFNQLTYPNARAIAYDYGSSGGMNDYLNRIAAIKDGGTSLSAYTYLGSGMVVRTAYPQPSVWLDLWGGTSGTFSGLDLFNRITDQLWQNNTGGTPAAIDEYRYGYDLNSNRQWKANVVGTAALSPNPGLDELYAYDPLNRLTQMQRGTLNTTHTAISGTIAREMDYTLDPVGNWNAYTTKTGGTTDLSQTRTQNKVNEITAIGGTPGWATPPAYDPAGNMTSMPQVVTPTSAFTATYDAWNRMVKISNTGGTVATYQYDGRNRRIVKVTTATSETRHFYYTSSWQDIEERIGASTSMDAQYVWGVRYIDELVCRDDATSTPARRLYALQDANFNLTAITDTSGTVQERYLFDPYGNRTIISPSWAVISGSAFAWVIGHQGLVHDQESGLVYNRSRYVLSSLGTFGGRDRIGYDGGLNLYGLAASNPISVLDPFGYGPTTNPTTRPTMGKQQYGTDGDPEEYMDYIQFKGIPVQGTTRVSFDWSVNDCKTGESLNDPPPNKLGQPNNSDTFWVSSGNLNFDQIIVGGTGENWTNRKWQALTKEQQGKEGEYQKYLKEFVKTQRKCCTYGEMTLTITSRINPSGATTRPGLPATQPTTRPARPQNVLRYDHNLARSYKEPADWGQSKTVATTTLYVEWTRCKKGQGHYWMYWSSDVPGLSGTDDGDLDCQK
jgi:RHS repeat-associated protein